MLSGGGLGEMMPFGRGGERCRAGRRRERWNESGHAAEEEGTRALSGKAPAQINNAGGKGGLEGVRVSA